ncbi:MAG: NUDIX hydrolase [Opitutaceae bacterium]|nr:NUDIX hydrolase [Cytophagales bacterium]
MPKYTYDYPRPALGTDMLLFSRQQEKIYILLIERGHSPFEGFWAFPGGFVEEGESCEQAVLRELKEETGLEHSELFQIGTFSEPQRDPRGWIVTVAFAAWINMQKTKPVAGDDAKNVKWFSLNEIPPLAFDHAIILKKAISDFVNGNSRS